MGNDPEQPRQYANTVSVLVVDDSDDVRAMTRDVLEQEGYAVTEASNGKEALELLMQGAQPRLILLDLTMPLMGGFEFMAIIKSCTRLAAIPVVVISGDTPHKIAEAHNTFARYMKKPVTADALIAVANELAGVPLRVVARTAKKPD
jgi:CheY-like chemotaxis protein